MKLISFLPVLASVFGLAAPISGYAKDKHDHHDHYDHHDHHDWDHHGSHVIIRPSFGYGYGYGSGYGSSYCDSPYYDSYPSRGYSYYSRPTTIYRGYRASNSYSDGLAVEVQRELRRRGYYRGPIDGDIGPGSRWAIRAYQRDRGLSATGRINSSLLRSLGVG